MFIVSLAAVVYNVNQVGFRQRLSPDRLLGHMNATIVSWCGASCPSVPDAGIWLLASPMRTLRDFPAAPGSDDDRDRL